MKSRSLLFTLSLLGVVSVGRAESTTYSLRPGVEVAPDTLITLTEDELVAGLRAIAEAYRAKEQPQRQPAELTAEHLRILKFQMLLNALGLGALPQQSPVAVYPQTLSHQSLGYSPYYAPSPWGYPQAQATQPQSTETADARLDRLEQMLLLLLQSRSTEPRTTTILPARQSEGSRVVERTTLVEGSSGGAAASDSLLYQLQRELSSLRSSMAETKAQPVEATSQPTPQLPQQSLPTPAVMPLTPLTPAQPIIRTDTIVQVREVPTEHTLLRRRVFFGVGQSRLSAEAQTILSEVLQAMEQSPTSRLYLTGYASPEGNTDRNDLLSLRRSREVRTYLVSRGITEDRVVSVAGGIDHRTDERGVARRVDLELRK